jgi:hypothetical protein
VTEVAVEYRDTGCNLAPSCLRCPFEVCQYDREQETEHRLPPALLARVVCQACGVEFEYARGKGGAPRRYCPAHSDAISRWRASVARRQEVQG